MILPNCPEYVIAFFACQRIGAVAVGNNPLYTERELEHQITDSGAKVMIVLDQIYHRFGQIRDAAGVQEVIAVKLNHYMPAPIKMAGAAEVQARRAQARHAAAVHPAGHTRALVGRRDEACRAGAARGDDRRSRPPRSPRSSTRAARPGLSKGAMLSHSNLVANARQASAWLNVVRQGEDGIVAALPFFHSFGTLVMDFAMTKAAKLDAACRASRSTWR